MSPQCRKWGISLAAAAILLVPAFSQTSSTTSSTGTGTSTGTPTRSGLPTSTTTGTTSTTGQTQIPQPIRVSGRVMVDDGTPPSFPAVIERLCNGNPHAEGYTDTQGYFSILLGQATGVIGDASDTSGISNRTTPLSGITGGSGTGLSTGTTRAATNRFDNCELRASLGGYRSQSINLASRRPSDDPDVGVILIHRMGASESATTVTATTLKAPKEARKALQKGMDLARKNKPEEAIASLREAVKVDPEFAFAWCELGKLQGDNGHAADAHASFQAAARAEPFCVSTPSNTRRHSSSTRWPITISGISRWPRRVRYRRRNSMCNITFRRSRIFWARSSPIGTSMPRQRRSSVPT